MSAIVPEARYRDYLMPLVQGFVDIATTVDGAVTCDYPAGLIGVGVGFTALRANIRPTSVSGPIPGACGSP